MTQGAKPSVLCDNLKGWGGVGWGERREGGVREGGDMCISVAYSC